MSGVASPPLPARLALCACGALGPTLSGAAGAGAGLGAPRVQGQVPGLAAASVGRGSGSLHCQRASHGEGTIAGVPEAALSESRQGWGSP